MWNALNIHSLTCTLILVTLYLRSILICMGMSKNIFPCAKFTRHRFTFAFTSQKLQQFSFGYKVIIMMKRAKMCGKHSSPSSFAPALFAVVRCSTLPTANRFCSVVGLHRSFGFSDLPAQANFFGEIIAELFLNTSITHSYCCSRQEIIVRCFDLQSWQSFHCTFRTTQHSPFLVSNCYCWKCNIFSQFSQLICPSAYFQLGFYLWPSLSLSLLLFSALIMPLFCWLVPLVFAPPFQVLCVPWKWRLPGGLLRQFNQFVR